MNILCSLSLFAVVASSTSLLKNTQIITSLNIFERIVHALQKFDEEHKPQVRWEHQSTHTGELYCTVEGDVMTSELTIALGVGQRTVWIYKMQKITCQNPDLAIDETNSDEGKWTKRPDPVLDETNGIYNIGKVTQTRLLGHDETESKNRFDVSSSRATGITMKRLKSITSSSRYNNIIYGVGSRLGTYLRILRFDLADDFKVTEHLLRRMNMKLHEKTVKICGFTSGHCPEESNCLLYCYCQPTKHRRRDSCKVLFFREPKGSYITGLITCQELELEKVVRKGRPKTTSLDRTGRVYMIVKHPMMMSEKLLIMSIMIKEGHHEMKLKILKEFPIRRHYVYDMDINRNGFVVFAENRIVLIDDTKKDILHSERKSFLINTRRVIKMDLGSLVCWLFEGNGIILINSHNPFKGKVVHL